VQGVLLAADKSEFPLPTSFTTRETLLPPGALSPPIKAGSLCLFTEGLTHGTLPWTAKHTRRTLLYKYAQKHCLFMRPACRPSATSGARLTEQQLLLFEPPSRIHAGWYPGIGASDQNPFPWDR
jgi:hypothetical protein